MKGTKIIHITWAIALFVGCTVTAYATSKSSDKGVGDAPYKFAYDQLSKESISKYKLNRDLKAGEMIGAGDVTLETVDVPKSIDETNSPVGLIAPKDLPVGTYLADVYPTFVIK